MTKLNDATRVKINLAGARRIYVGPTKAWEFQPHLDTRLGWVSTPDTANMTSDPGALRLGFRAQVDDIGASFPSMVAKESGGNREFMVYMYAPAGNMVAFSTIPPQVDVVMTGNGIPATPIGVPATWGFEWTPGSASCVSILDGVRRSITAGGALTTPDTTGPVVIAGLTTMRVKAYWAQLEAINRARLVFPGVLFNVLTVPDAPNLNVSGDIQVTCRCERPASGPTTQRVVSKDTNNATGNRGWALTWSGGQLGFAMLPSNSILSSTTVPVAAGAMVWIRCTRANSTGVCTLQWAPDSPNEPTTGWTTMATTGTPLVGAVPVTTGAVRIGDRATTPVDPLDPYAGRVARVIIRDGSTVVLDINENNAGVMTTPTTFVATTGQTVTVQDSSTGAFLAGQLATVSTPDPGVLPNSFVIVYKARNNSSAGFPVHAAQTTGSDPRSWQTYPTLINGRIYWEATPDGVWANRQQRYGDKPTSPALNVDRIEAIAVTQDSSGRHLMTGWSYNEATATWTAGTTRDTGTAFTAFDVATTLVMGNGFVKGERLYWSEMRTGTDPRAGTVIYRFDGNEFPGGAGLSYTDPRSRTWTLTAANSIIAKAPGPIVQPQADSVIWRFDAKDYPGSGTSYADPRGRTWTLSAAGAIAGP